MDRKIMQECFDYNDQEGILTWRLRPKDHFQSERHWKSFNARYYGKQAGNKHDKRFTVGINGKTYLANRIAAIFLGYKLDENSVVICIDGDHFNIRKDNLFISDRRVVAVIRESSKENPDKCIYVRPNGKFQVQIGVDGETLYGGVFDSMDEARSARNEIFKFIYGGEK
jgi:hypothetical protein